MKLGLGQKIRGYKLDPVSCYWQTPKGKKRISQEDVIRWIEDHKCAICGDGPDLDIRYLRISCFYDLTEISTKFQQASIDIKEGGKYQYYILGFCKPCRGHFMTEILGKWLESKGHKEHPNWNDESPIQFV